MHALLAGLVALTSSTSASLILQVGFAEKGCKGDAIPVTVSRTGVCGPMSSTFSATFSANSSNVHVDIYNTSGLCSGEAYAQRDEPVGECLAASYQYHFPAAKPKATCLLWGHTDSLCPQGQAMSATVAQTTGKCRSALATVYQTFAVVAGRDKYNITTYQ